MAPDHRPWSLFLESVRRLPADLTVVIGLTILTVLAVVLPGIRETAIRIVLGLPFLLFLPGYAFISALFPKAGGSFGVDGKIIQKKHRITGIERIALAFGMSIAIVSLLGLSLHSTPWGIHFISVVMSVSGFTVGCTVIAALRRWELPAEERFSVPYREWIAAGQTEILKTKDQTNTAKTLNVALVLSIVLAVGIVGFAVASSQDDDQFTRFYLLTEDDNGELVIGGYPKEFTQGEAQSMFIGIDNQEYETVEYTVVVQLERVDSKESRTKVQEREVLDQFNTELSHNETRDITREITPIMAGEELRLTFLLYNGDPPENPTVENSYRNLQLWITVEESNIQEPIEIPAREADAQGYNPN